MYNHQPEDYVCPYCKIIESRGTNDGMKQNDRIVFTDKLVTICVTAKWWRSNPGHIIVIPNQHIENIYDMPEEVGHRIFNLSKTAAIALKHAYACDGTSVRQHNEPAGDQHVWHYHSHVFPRYQGDNLYLNHQKTYRPTAEEIKPYVDKLKPYFDQFRLNHFQ